MLFKGKRITCQITYEKEKYSFDLERHKTVNDLYIAFQEKMQDNCPFIIIFNPNNSTNNKDLYEINNLETTLISLEKDKNDSLNFEFVKPYKCPSCLKYCDNDKKIINKYCIECNMYICSDCDKDKKHEKHYLIDIDRNNLKDSIKLWNINLNAELSEQITNYNKQIKFITEDLDIKIKIWIKNIYKEIKAFENLMNNIKMKIQELKYYFDESENILNKAMSNLTKSEQEINIEFFNESKGYLNKYISFEQAEEQIQKLKINYNEIFKAKKDMYDIVSQETIKKWGEVINNVPKIFAEMPNIGNLVLNELKIYEMKSRKNSSKKENSSLGRRKKPDLNLGNNNLLFKTANEVQIGILRKKNKNKNIYILQNYQNNINNERKKTDFSLKLKRIININDTNAEDNNNKADYTYRGLIELLDRKKSGEYKAFENEGLNNIKYLNKGRNRYTPKNVKLPKIINNDKEKYNGNYFKSNYDDINKITISSKK